jgi:methionine-rich copper-binding protein CopC
MRTSALVIVLCSLLLLIQWPHSALGHALLVRAEPKVGERVSTPPARVRIWFDSALGPSLCKIRVQDPNGKQVDNDDSRVIPPDEKLLEVSLPLLPPGIYHVIWSVVSRDGHKTNGDYIFTIKPGN